MKSLKNNEFFLFLIFFESCLVLMYLSSAMLEHRLLKLFDLNGEGNLPAWFASVQLFLIGQQFFYKWKSKKEARISKIEKFCFILSLIFIFLSVDEAASIHERITSILRNLSWIPSFTGNHGIWIFLYVPMIVVFGSIFFKSFSLLKKYYPYGFRLISCGASLMIGGAVFLEIVGYEVIAGENHALHVCEVALEEFLEMLGATLILFGARSLNDDTWTDLATLDIQDRTPIIPNANLEPVMMFSSTITHDLGQRQVADLASKQSMENLGPTSL